MPTRYDALVISASSRDGACCLVSLRTKQVPSPASESKAVGVCRTASNSHTKQAPTHVALRHASSPAAQHLREHAKARRPGRHRPAPRVNRPGVQVRLRRPAAPSPSARAVAVPGTAWFAPPGLRLVPCDPVAFPRTPCPVCSARREGYPSRRRESGMSHARDLGKASRPNAQGYLDVRHVRQFPTVYILRHAEGR